MVVFRSNNNRRPSFRRNDRNFKRNGESSKFKSNFSSNENFQRKIPGKNNHNASRLIEKYTDLAREALANEDKILSENYFQHADHFTRVMNEQEQNRLIKNTSEETKLVEENKKPIANIKDKKQTNS
jgi:catalase